jgi:hypothetical protein
LQFAGRACDVEKGLATDLGAALYKNYENVGKTEEWSRDRAMSDDVLTTPTRMKHDIGDNPPTSELDDKRRSATNHAATRPGFRFSTC